MNSLTKDRIFIVQFFILLCFVENDNLRFDQNQQGVFVSQLTLVGKSAIDNRKLTILRKSHIEVTS